MDASTSSTVTFRCALCGDTFNSNKQLINHRSVHAKENRIFKCIKCETCFTDYCEFLVHGVTHMHHKIELKCIECGASKKKITLPMHIMTHFDQRKQACEFCNIVLSVEELKKHVKTHSVLNNTRECKICGKMLITWKFEAHMANHNIDKRFPCLYCNKFYSSKKLLRVHVKGHTGERTEVCNICGQLFKNRGTLRWHEKKHKLGNKYQCDYCEKVFYDKSGIVHHIMQHTRGFRCMCKNCKFRAPTREEVVAHQKTAHYYCTVCKKYFASGSTFRSHMSSRTHKNVAASKNLDVDY